MKWSEEWPKGKKSKAAATIFVIVNLTEVHSADDYFIKMALKNIAGKVKEIPLRNVFDTSGKRTITSMFNWEPKEVETHTGQKWNKSDYRMVRFMGKKKLVNSNWGIKLIAEIPPIPVNGRVASCDGGGGPTGHPQVFINLDKPGNHACLYCGLRFYKEESH